MSLYYSLHPPPTWPLLFPPLPLTPPPPSTFDVHSISPSQGDSCYCLCGWTAQPPSAHFDCCNSAEKSFIICTYKLNLVSVRWNVTNFPLHSASLSPNPFLFFLFFCLFGFVWFLCSCFCSEAVHFLSLLAPAHHPYCSSIMSTKTTLISLPKTAELHSLPFWLLYGPQRVSPPSCVIYSLLSGFFPYLLHCNYNVMK